MPSFCLIVGCSNDKKNSPDLSFRRVPKVITHQGPEMGISSSERRRLSLAAISRDDLTEKKLQNDRVCGAHFHSGKAAFMWDRLDVDWVPSLNLRHIKVKKAENEKER